MFFQPPHAPFPPIDPTRNTIAKVTQHDPVTRCEQAMHHFQQVHRMLFFLEGAKLLEPR